MVVHKLLEAAKCMYASLALACLTARPIHEHDYVT